MFLNAGYVLVPEHIFRETNMNSDVARCLQWKDFLFSFRKKRYLNTKTRSYFLSDLLFSGKLIHNLKPESACKSPLVAYTQDHKSARRQGSKNFYEKKSQQIFVVNAI